MAPTFVPYMQNSATNTVIWSGMSSGGGGVPRAWAALVEVRGPVVGVPGVRGVVAERVTELLVRLELDGVPLFVCPGG